MRIEKVDPFTGELNSLELPVTQKDLLRLNLGENPDAVLAKLRPWQRDFIVTGVFSPPWGGPPKLETYEISELLVDFMQDK